MQLTPNKGKKKLRVERKEERGDWQVWHRTSACIHCQHEDKLIQYLKTQSGQNLRDL